MCEGTWNGIDLAENRVRMERGELYTAFTPDLVALRRKAAQACAVYNREATEVSRRQQVELLRQCITTLPELPPAQEGEDEDEALKDFPWFEPPFKVDYAERFEVGRGTFANFNLVVLNTCKVTIGSGCLFGPNVGLYAATHPIDPAIRQGTAGPELGGPIEIGDNCWFGGSITVLPNVKIGTGVVVGAGSVVTKSIPPFVVVAGVPAKIIKKVESEWATAYFKEHPEEEWFPPAKEITRVFGGREGR